MSLKCFLCCSEESDPVIYGEFKTLEDITVHYYCLLLGPNLINYGEDEEGILGFKLEDIKNEEKRIRGQSCYFCKKKHANISCSIKRCQRSFHTDCGVQKGCLMQYSGSFASFCKDHALKKIKDDSVHEEAEECGICFDLMGPYNKITSIRAPCCNKSWFHQYCLQKYAKYGGYFFKCPLCNDVATIGKEVKDRGIFVPEKDAEWELEPQAFSELLERPTKCEAVICKCTEGRDYSDEFSWKTTRCRSCGSLACHVLCMDGQLNYLCELCTKIVPQDAECLQSEVVESELDDIDGWDTESEDEILNPPWSSKKIGSKKVRKIIDSGKDKEEKKILFYKNEMLKLGKHKIKKCSVLLKDCELKDKNVTETVKEADKLDEVEDSLMSSCASYVDRLSPLPIDKIQCSLITSSKNNGKTEGVFEDLKKQLMMDTSACSGSSRDENSNERTAETSSKRKLVDDIEKPDAKKSKMNSSVLQKQDSNVVRKTLGISKKKISQRVIAPGQKTITSFFHSIFKNKD